MSLFHRVALTFVIAQSVASAVAWACSCAVPDTTTDEELAAHGMVFVGEVVSGPRRGCGASPFVQSSADPTFYTLEVTEAFKGVAEGDAIEIETAASGSSCGVSFQVGEEWLIFTDDGRYALCDPGGLASENAETVDELRAILGE